MTAFPRRREGRHARRRPHILLLMAETLRELLADLERDAFCRDRCGVHTTGRRLSRGNTGRRRARVDRARPRRPRGAVRGAAASRRPAARRRARPAEERRPAGLQPPDASALDGAPGVRAPPGRRLDRGADRRPQPVRRGLRNVPGRHDHRNAGRAVDVQSGRVRAGERRHVHLRRHRGHVRRPARGAPGGQARCMAPGHRRSPAGRGLRRTRALRRGEGGRRAWPRHGQRRCRALARLPHERGGARRCARRPARCRPPGDGGGRHGRLDAHRVIRRYRRDRAHLRGARAVAARRRSARCIRPAVARAPIAAERAFTVHVRLPGTRTR